jgi:outer membrane protein TolC
MRIYVALLLCTASAFAEIKTMTLREALNLALAQNPDLMLARLDQQKARAQVTIARDPFQPKVYAGSGAAWTSGFPASIDGSAPAILQLKTQMSLFDQPQRYQIAAANENARGAGIDASRREDEVAYRVAALFFDAQRAARSVAAAQREIENLSRVVDLVKARIEEGREVPIAGARSSLNLRGAQRTADSLALDQLQAETSLAIALGLNPDDRVRAAEEEQLGLTVPASEQDSIAAVLESSPELKRLQSSMQAKELEIKSYRAQRLPKVSLVAQYELFAKYYYQDYFAAFQRNSGQLGASFDVPVLVGRSARAYISQAETDIEKLRIQTDQARARITADLRRSFQEVKRAESGRDFAREDLDVARHQVSDDLALNDEGRLPMAALEQARAVEQEKWLAYYDAQHALEVAKLNVLRDSGTILAALK